MLQTAHQTQPAQTDEVPDINHVWPERIQRFQENMDVEGVDVTRARVPQSQRDDVVFALKIGRINIGQLEGAAHMRFPPLTPPKMGGVRGGHARDGGKDEHVMAGVGESVGRLSAAEFVAAEKVRRVEVAEDQDPHAASSTPPASRR